MFAGPVDDQTCTAGAAIDPLRLPPATFDTLKAATRLREKAGFKTSSRQPTAAAFADGFVENVATMQVLSCLTANGAQA